MAKQYGEIMPRKIFAARKPTLRLFPDEVEMAEVKSAGGVSGFLHLQCSRCGEVKSFCTKRTIDTYYCKCGCRTRLSNLTVMTISCECGGRAKYLTNREESSFDIKCFYCGMPVAVEYRPGRGRYEPMGWREGKKRK